MPVVVLTLLGLSGLIVELVASKGKRGAKRTVRGVLDHAACPSFSNLTHLRAHVKAAHPSTVLRVVHVTSLVNALASGGGESLFLQNANGVLGLLVTSQLLLEVLVGFHELRERGRNFSLCDLPSGNGTISGMDLGTKPGKDGCDGERRIFLFDAGGDLSGLATKRESTKK